MKIRITDYRLGFFIGALFSYGLISILMGLEFLAFGGFLIEWGVTNAFLVLLIGLGSVGLSYRIHKWAKSLIELEKVQ